MIHGATQVGSILAGRYRVERVLGQGGMGVVVQATHLQLQQPVALKFLLPEVLENRQAVERFLREAQAVVRLRGEHVARVLDIGTLDTGTPYVVFEFLEGADLARFPRSQLTAGAIVDLALQACEGLAEAHASGIVHRDIKPANLFITRRADGSLWLKILDFGISKISTGGAPLTMTQTVLGTAAYMSPEQMRSSRDVDPRSDIWSLGIVLYELFQGAPPFDSESFSATVLRVAHDPTPRLTVQLPGELDRIVYRCLEKDPARRFQTTAELAVALAPYAQSPAQAAISVQRTRGIVGASPVRAVITPAAPPGPALPSTISGAAAATTTSRRAGRRWPAVGLGAVLVGGVAALVMARGGDEPGPHAAGVAVDQRTPPPPALPPVAPAVPPVALERAPRAALPAVDGGVLDAPSDAIAVAPSHRQDPASGDVPHPPPTGENHGSPTRPAAPAKKDPPKPARPVFDRGD